MLDGYNREELIHIVDMYNLNIDMETLKIHHCQKRKK